ncbi:kinase domain-containing protein [Salix suchowensis]|nr:kinase domain-containing protein [Salix suchowensis]
MWDGKEDRTSCVTVQDLSSNGTFVSNCVLCIPRVKAKRAWGYRSTGPRSAGAIPKSSAKEASLRSEPVPSDCERGIEDYRFVYRHLAAGPPTEGLYKYYDLCNELGKGSFATVMKAVHLATGEWVAIKMIQDKKANAAGTNANADGNGTTRHQAFMREISIMEQLKHPNICELKETMCGTPSYLAPEVVKQQNAEGYDNLVDSWSVGVIVFSMLTNAGPFIEDENQRDIRMRIIERQIDWDTLYNSNVSQEAQSFIRSLLVDNPTRRMTLTDALHHPWLQSYTPSILLPLISNNTPVRVVPSPATTFPCSPISRRDEPGSSHNVVDIKREGSRSQPLQRRARVLEDAAEGKGEILQPSQEMINAVLLLEPGTLRRRLIASVLWTRTRRWRVR